MPSHATFVALAYGVAAVAVCATIAAIMLDYRKLRRALEKLGAPLDQREDDA
jgi:heme exporter protein CcmD